jgi:hypothetical protein
VTLARWANPNDWEPVTLTNLTDALNTADANANCVLDNGSAAGTQLAANGGHADFPYTCIWSQAPVVSNNTNVATAFWDANVANTTDGSASGSADFAFTDPTSTTNKKITVTDSQAGQLGTLTAVDSPPLTSQTFTYNKTFAPPASGCVTVTNVAKIVETGQTATDNVKNCNSGALTMGFWQNKNGQGIIGAANPTALQAFLAGYHPFSDAPSTGLAGYVSNIIKAATCTSTSKTCNSMLRAQMLSTALDVYFSANGNNKINAPAPIGGLTVDLTHICKMIDGSGGTATCSGSYENVSSVFGGVTSLTVLQMLNYQNTSDPLADAGAVWYGQNKTNQVMAKDAFDAINNQVVSGP